MARSTSPFRCRRGPTTPPVRRGRETECSRWASERGRRAREADVSDGESRHGRDWILPLRKRDGFAAVLGLLSACTAAYAVEPPRPSDLRVAFEAQFPKSDANGTALDLERLAARIGIDLAPRALADPEKP